MNEDGGVENECCVSILKIKTKKKEIKGSEESKT